MPLGSGDVQGGAIHEGGYFLHADGAVSSDHHYRQAGENIAPEAIQRQAAGLGFIQHCQAAAGFTVGQPRSAIFFAECCQVW